ncbi:cyanate transporter [Methylobacter sp. S3L5C]|uniref:cyanate transporter n=1 Tax=Methylobacter sp. S3L5C TaxID=2839024 RepID=UPI001FAD189C|nr:cyanate transporter [Methylobacter sp. S3L5C]UOA09885.1 cyanate transporter [Methylobacter sp. S3L5C]
MKKNLHAELRQNNPLFITIICIVLVALNLRPSMASFGPLLTQITNSIGITYTQTSLLTMLPVIAMGIGMFFGGKIKSTIGLVPAIFIALILIGVATAARYFYFDVTSLITTAIISGLGIAIIQALMPAFIKSNFTNTPLLMGFYATAIMGGAAISASLSALLANKLNSWQLSLAIWAIFALVGLIAWRKISLITKNLVNQPTKSEKTQDNFFTNRRAWLLALFFGFGTATYTCVLAWLAPFYLDLGFTDQEAGMILGLLTLFEVVSGLIIPMLSAKKIDRRGYLLLLLLFVAIGFIGLAFSPLKLVILWPALLGIGIGGLFPMSLIVSMDHIHSPKRSGNLTAFTQGVGYIIAGLSPLIAGFIRSETNSFQYSWLLLALVMVIMIPMALSFNPTGYSEKFD